MTQVSFRQRLFAQFMVRANDLAHTLYGDRKRQLLGDLRGRVLEIGPGTGVNLQYLDPGIEWIGIEPNAAMHRHLLAEAKRLGMSARLEYGMSESLQVADESVDAVVSTLVLCSVADMSKTLAEVLRVLKPGGRFVFLEHVADRPWTVRLMIQKIMPFTPWRFFSDGCNPGRRIGEEIARAGFASVDLHPYMQPGPGPILAINRPHIFGTAAK